MSESLASLTPVAPDAPLCHARSKTSGVQCKRHAIRGGTVCRYHGGAAPQVMAKAERRLRAMVDPMISRLEELALQTDNPKVAAECVRDALDRAGIGALVQSKVTAARAKANASTASGVTVNIGFLVRHDATPDALDATTLDAEPITDTHHPMGTDERKA